TATRPAGISIFQPIAKFHSADTIGCTGKPVVFTNTSVGSALQSAWNFGDGSLSTITHPVYNYASIGTYSIKLIVTDQYGCKDSAERPDYVTISYPKARMTVSDSFSTCPPLLVHFAHTSSDYAALRWEFGDGTASLLDSPSHFYTVAGIYYARLVATGPGGCADTAVQRIEIKGPSGSFSYTPLTGCKPLTVNFTAVAKNIATYTWDFADGNIAVTSDSLISHTYNTAGDYLPKLILTDDGGCSVPIFGGDTIKVNGVTAGFTVGNNAFCNDGTVQFANTTVGNDFITSYQWTFGDGATSSAQHPAHYYAAPGLYTVSLRATSLSGCLDSLTYVDTVKVYANPIVSISHDSSGCVPVTIRFSGNVLSGDASAIKWNWTLGNGDTDTLQAPLPRVYSLANSYSITTIATDNHGCRDTATASVSAYPIPVVDAGPDIFICRGAFAALTASGATSYSWNASPTLSCTSCASPLAAPTDSAQYYVTGASVFGCVAIDSVTVKVHQPFTLKVGPGDTVCAGSTVQLRASGTDKYSWIPSTAVSAPNVGITTAAPMVTTTYKVVAQDNHNCFTDTGWVHIKVWPYPTVNAGDDRTVGIGTTLIMQPTYSPDIITYQWSNPMQTLSCTTCPVPTVHTQGVQNTYKIEVANDGGCVAKDEVTINTVCNGGNLFIPNTFSPNGDGKNDIFHPRGSGVNKVKSLKVYNRWGETVFSAANLDVNDASAGWDGRYKGLGLPPDVYVYTCEVVCMNNEVLIYNGNVTLLK
ncbi:MAG TPA: PKD domain-containing protein, partial [Flavisolibacter sp.]|nr:PKD domain-containing protein [Flavisolibacter sp.]